MQKIVFIYFIVINITAFIIYGVDKYLAILSKYRISEKELHIFSIVGGFIGATFGMILFRHKVKKRSFLFKHIAIIVLWGLLLFYYFGIFNQLNFLR